MNKDLVIIGGGPGGYEVAIKAANSGLNVALIEKSEIGGTCLNQGCIPTKALYKNAEVAHLLKQGDEFGFTDLSYSLDFTKVQERKNQVIGQLKNNIKMMLDKAKVEVINGMASFKDEHTITVVSGENTAEITADHFIIATGSEEKVIPIEGYQLSNVVTSKEMLDINIVPSKLVIIGGGVIGVEMATIFNRLGSEVTIYEYFDRLLPMMDEDISSRIKVYLKKLGIEVINDALVERIEKDNENLIVSGKTKKGKEFSTETEYVLMATGRKAYYDNLNLDKINVLYDKNGIVVNENMQTSIEHIYAVGDVTGINMLAHVATYQSYKALDHILNKDNETNFKVIPACVFTFPEIAVVGMTEAIAREKYGDIKVNKFMFRANGKALSMGEAEGFVKVIAHDDILLGCHIIGPQASSLIQEATVLIERKISLKNAVEIIHAHPTLTEAILEAIRGLIE